MAARVIDFAFACLSHEPLLPFRLTRLARAAALDRAATLAGRHRTDAMLLALPTWHRETAAPDIAQYRRAWRSIRNARSPLFRRMRPGRRLIHIISDAEPTNSADSVQTLLKGYKAAIRGSTGSRSVLCAPRIVLRFGGFFDAEDG